MLSQNSNEERTLGFKNPKQIQYLVPPQLVSPKITEQYSVYESIVPQQHHNKFVNPVYYVPDQEQHNEIRYSNIFKDSLFGSQLQSHQKAFQRSQTISGYTESKLVQSRHIEQSSSSQKRNAPQDITFQQDQGQQQNSETPSKYQILNNSNHSVVNSMYRDSRQFEGSVRSTIKNPLRMSRIKIKDLPRNDLKTQDFPSPLPPADMSIKKTLELIKERESLRMVSYSFKGDYLAQAIQKQRSQTKVELIGPSFREKSNYNACVIF